MEEHHKSSLHQKEVKERIVTMERIIFVIIIGGLLIWGAIASGMIEKVNPWKKFTYNWEASTAKSFENSEITPYCVDGLSKEDYRSMLAYFMGGSTIPTGITSFELCSDINFVDNPNTNTVPTIVYEIIKFSDASSAYSALEKSKANTIAMGPKSFYSVDNKDQQIYIAESNGEFKYEYLWISDKYFFVIMGKEDFKSKKLVQWVIEQYTGEKDVSLNKTREIMSLTCGDGICSASINEDCNSCTKDCNCQGGNICTKETYSTAYSCKTSSGNYCSYDSDCSTGHCVHNMCRTETTFCGDNQCDNYDSIKPENCGNCQTDCGCQYNQQCINNQCKASSGSSCSSFSDCATGYCVHNTCRGAQAYCGDGFCDYPETKDNCPSDCYY